MAKIIGQAEFDREVLKSSTPVLVDFFATWCGPCKMLAPAIEEISNEMSGVAKVLKIDVDQSTDLAINYDIKSVPTLMLFKNGQPVDTIVGVVPKATIMTSINNVL